MNGKRLVFQVGSETREERSAVEWRKRNMLGPEKPMPLESFTFTISN